MDGEFNRKIRRRHITFIICLLSVEEKIVFHLLFEVSALWGKRLFSKRGEKGQHGNFGKKSMNRGVRFTVIT